MPGGRRGGSAETAAEAGLPAGRGAATSSGPCRSGGSGDARISENVQSPEDLPPPDSLPAGRHRSIPSIGLPGRSARFNLRKEPIAVTRRRRTAPSVACRKPPPETGMVGSTRSGTGTPPEDRPPLNRAEREFVAALARWKAWVDLEERWRLCADRTAYQSTRQGRRTRTFDLGSDEYFDHGPADTTRTRPASAETDRKSNPRPSE